MSHTERPENNLQHIQQQLETAQKEFAALKMQPKESLRNFEYRVKRLSDKILALKVAEQVQKKQIEQGAREAEEQLKKSP